MLHSICQQIWKTQQWPQDWKRSVFIPIPKKGNAKECSNHRTIALMLASNAQNPSGFNSSWIENFQIYKLYLEKGEEPEIKLPTFVASWRKQGNKKKKFTSASLTILKHLTVWITTNCGKFLQRWGYSQFYLCPEKLVEQEAAVRTGLGTMDWFKIRKRVQQGCILSSCLFNFYVEYFMQNAGLDESQSGIKTAGRHINNLRYADNTT